MAGCLWKNNSFSRFLFPLSKLSPGNLFCCLSFIPLNFLRICCLCWDDFEVQAGCADVTIMQAVVRALLCFRVQAHQSDGLHETLCLTEQVSLIFWLLQGSKHCQQSQECCNGICQDISTVKMNLFPCFMLMKRWKGCPYCPSQQFYTRQGKKKLPLLSKPGSLSARTDIPGQTTSLPVLPLFPACWGCPEGLFPSEQILCFICTLLCWNLFPLGAWRCGHPMRQLAHSYFEHYKLKKATPKWTVWQVWAIHQWGWIILPTHFDKIWERSSGYDKGSERGHRWTHTRNHSHAYAVGTIASLAAHISSSLALHGQWRNFLWLLMMLCSWITEGAQLTGLVSSCWDFGCYMHSFGHASESSLKMRRSQRNLIFYFLFLLKNKEIFPCLLKNCWEVYPELLFSIPPGNYFSNARSYISSQSFTTHCTWWIIMSDCGPQFREHKIGQFAVKFGFRHITASLHHSQYNRRWKKALK